jgi:hypothetical protein
MMKDDVNDKVPNGTPKNQNLSNGVLKSSVKPKRDHVTRF